MKLILLFTILFHLLSAHGVVVRVDPIVRDVALNGSVSPERSAVLANGVSVSPGFPNPTKTSPRQVAPPGNCGGSGDSEPSFCVGTQSGQATFHSVGLGACGTTNSNSDHVVAVSHLLFDNFPGYDGIPSDNPVCGRKLIASFQGKSVTVTVEESCIICQKITDLDFSPSAFTELANVGLGRIDVTWVWA